jgi:hypothetical protein
MAIPKFEADLNIISQLPDRPNDERGLSPQAFKEEFDRAGLLVKEYINEILVPQANIDIDNAAKGIGGSDGIDGSTLVDGTVTASKLAPNSVTTEKIASESVTAGKIAPKAVTEENYADASIGDRAFKQGGVTSAALAQNSVTADKIAESAVTGAKLANGSVGTAKIADASVTDTKIARGAVTGLKSVLIPTTGWERYNNSESNVYFIDIAVNGLRSADRGDLMLQRGIAPDISTYSLAAFERDIENLSHILAAKTVDGALRLYADEIPSASTYCYLRVVKK